MKRNGLVGILLGLCAVVVWSAPAIGQDLTLKRTEMNPPEEVVAELRDLVDTNAIQLLDSDKPVFEFWFRKDIPLSAKPSGGTTGLSVIKEITYLGIARLHERRKDFRNDDIEPGVYAMRLGILPTDGDHLGTSPFPYMAILVPAKYDEGLGTIPDRDTLAELSGQDTFAEHPNTLSLQPLNDTETEGEFPRTGQGGEDWKFVYLKLPAKVEGDGEAELTFKMVYEGHGHL